MVFSSLPLYLDPPNWQQQHPPPQNHELQAPNPSQIPPPPPQQGGPTRASSSMADRARQAKIPVPEGPLKCPRCESTNTKFCYFNNYSLSQPRHFCKTCRRYWTRGGSLRSVPVGGGCRRNKRKKSGAARANSKSCGSPSSKVEPRHQTQSTPPSAAGEFGGGQHHLLQAAAVGGAPPPPFSFMASSLQNLTQLGMGNLGLNFGALGIGGAHNSGSHLGGYGEEEAQQQQLPNLLAGFGTTASLMYPFQNMQGMETASYGKGLGLQNQQMQQGGVKMEGLGVGLGQHQNQNQNQNQQQFWSNGGGVNGTSGGLWTDLSGICSSSTSTHNILR